MTLCAAMVAVNADAEELMADHRPVLRPETHRTPLVERKVIRLQPHLSVTRARDEDGTELTFAALNPSVNDWFVLEQAIDRISKRTYHLENADPINQAIRLENTVAPYISIRNRHGIYRCAPWRGSPSVLSVAGQLDLPFVPICDQRLFVRNAVTGRQSWLELATDTLRKHGAIGDFFISVVKRLRSGLKSSRPAIPLKIGDEDFVQVGPPAALLHTNPVMRTQIGISFSGGQTKRMKMGNWHPVDAAAGVYVSATQPGLVAPALLSGDTKANNLDPVEALADAYLVAFDLARFDIGYEPGTKHPDFGWSTRPPITEAGHSPGPDGFFRPTPLVTTGTIRPDEVERTVAVFTGGFKREHSAFREGPMSLTSNGHHYGIIAHGALLSRLNPGLSTLFVDLNGRVDMKEWSKKDHKTLLQDLRFARQNGVPLVHKDPVTGRIEPGPLVRSAKLGNWMGDSNAALRTLRAGACLVETAKARFLIYALFTQATPSAMARVFQSYGCKHAMQLDMNAVVHTYMAVFERSEQGLFPKHLVPEMSALDVEKGGSVFPRFLMTPDNRDFFYILHKKVSE